MEDQQEFSPQVTNETLIGGSSKVDYNDYAEMRKLAADYTTKYNQERDNNKSLDQKNQELAAKLDDQKKALEELSKRFDDTQSKLDRVSKADKVVEVDRLDWNNGNVLARAARDLGYEDVDVLKAVLDGRIKVRRDNSV